MRPKRFCATALGNVTVLDLACGDGYWLALQRQRLGDDTRLIGVDLSLDELGAARAAGSKDRLAVRVCRRWLMPEASFRVERGCADCGVAAPMPPARRARPHP